VAVLVVINSPGGSAVQAQMIAERLAALSKEKKIPVIAYVEDMAASGGYMIALGAEEIVCNPFSLVGSVGVITAGFGLDKLIDKLGVERRVYTAGTHKSKLDPFRPEEPGDVEFVKGMLHDMHVLFIDMVKERRGAKLRPDLGDLFNGDVWPARKAMELGLVDQVGDIRGVLKARFGDKARIVQVGPQSFADLLADSMPSSRLGLEGLVSAIGGGWGISASSSIGGGGGGYVS
jgi:signal peptide peptidase SppA